MLPGLLCHGVDPGYTGQLRNFPLPESFKRRSSPVAVVPVFCNAVT